MVCLREGRVEMWNTASGARLTMEWDPRALPHAWLWHEVRVSVGRWRELGEVLALEPASVPYSLGLARAIEAGSGKRVGASRSMRPAPAGSSRGGGALAGKRTPVRIGGINANCSEPLVVGISRWASSPSRTFNEKDPNKCRGFSTWS
jgi:hypothetical protein